MAYDGTGPGIGESRLFAVQSILQARLSVLNAALGRDTRTSYLLSPAFGGPVTSLMVVIGDVFQLWDRLPGTITATNPGGSIRIAVCSGSHQSGRAFLNNIEFITEGGHRMSWYTSVYGYFHHDAFRNSDPVVQSETIEVARERLSDWIRWVLNYYGGPMDTNQALTLGSQEFVSGAGHDYLLRCRAAMGDKGFFTRDFGNSHVLYGVHIQHIGEIAGVYAG